MTSRPLPELWTSASLDEDLAVYRRLHQNPELSGEEHQTAGFVAERLDALGAEVVLCGGTGVVGVMRNGAGPTIAFRADMDALPIREQTGLAFASEAMATLPDGTETSVMHACGHDMHVTVALAVARTMAAHRDEWSGTVVWIFQPAEETASGAAAMVDDGLWEKVPRPDVLLAQHVKAIPCDQVLIGTGNIMNLGDSWRVTVKGSGAHASRPEESIDPIVLAAHIVVRLQTVVSREIAAAHPAVVTVGTFHAGLKENVIPDEAVISLNIRTPDPQTRDRVLEVVRRILRGEAIASGAPEPVIEEINRFPRCFNDPHETGIVARALESVFGADKVDRDFRTTGSEDVGWLADSIGVPLVFWFFGAYHPGREGPLPQNHTAQFGPDAEQALTAGVRAALSALDAQFTRPYEARRTG